MKYDIKEDLEEIKNRLENKASDDKIYFDVGKFTQAVQKEVDQIVAKAFQDAITKERMFQDLKLLLHEEVKAQVSISLARTERKLHS